MNIQSQESVPKIPGNILTVLCLFLILLCFLVFNYFTVDKDDFWADEIGTIEAIRHPGTRLVWEHLKEDIHAPLYFLFLHYFDTLTRSRGIQLRWFSVFWGMMGILGLYYWIKWSFDRRKALLAALFLAINPFWLFYCRELRMYTMFPAFLWWGSGFVSLGLKTGRKSHWFIAGLLNALALWTHYLAFFYIVPEIVTVFLLLHKGEKASLPCRAGDSSKAGSGLKILIAFIILATAPLAGLMMIQVSTNMGLNQWISSPSWYGLFQSWFQAYITFYQHHYIGSIGIWVNIVSGIVMGLLFMWGFLHFPGDRKAEGGNRDLLASCAFLPLILIFSASFSPLKLFLVYRYTILCLGPFLALFSYILFLIGKKHGMIYFLLFFVVLEIFSNYALVTHKEKPPWRKIVGIMDQNLKEGDVLITNSLLFGNGYTYYSEKKFPLIQFEDLMLRPDIQASTIYNLVYVASAKEIPHPFLPWIARDFMKSKWPETTLYKGERYEFEKYANVDLSYLRRWYVGRKTWGRSRILKRKPAAFIGAEDLRYGALKKHSYPLQLDKQDCVYTWLHSPPVRFTFQENLPAGEYNLFLKMGINDLPSSETVIQMKAEGREEVHWSLQKYTIRFLEAKVIKKTDREKMTVILNGEGFRGSSIDSLNPDTNLLLAHFYWIALVGPEFQDMKQFAVGSDQPEVVIYPAMTDMFPLLGLGWGDTEKWGEKELVAMNGPRGEVYLPLWDSGPLSLSLLIYPFHPDHPPPLSLSIKINGKETGSRNLKKSWNELEWSIEPEDVHSGLNLLELIPSRTLYPRMIDPGIKDSRSLSIWLYRIRVKRK